MGKRTIAWLVFAISLILVGCIIFGGTMTLLNWDFTNLSTVKFETNNYAINEPYQNIAVITDTANITFLPSENGETKIICHEQKNSMHTVAVNDGALTIQINDTKKWYEHIGISFRSPKITVFIPERTYGDLSVTVSTGHVEVPETFQFESITITASTGTITNRASASESVSLKTSTGDILVEAISAGTMDLTVSTGKVTLTDITCESVVSHGSTGRVALKNVVASKRFSIEQNTGDVTFDRCDAPEIYVKTTTGHVKGSLLTGKLFDTQTGTGHVDVPASAGGKCQIRTDTGDIEIRIEP